MDHNLSSKMVHDGNFQGSNSTIISADAQKSVDAAVVVDVADVEVVMGHSRPPHRCGHL